MGCTVGSNNIHEFEDIEYAMEAMGFEFSDSNKLRDIFNSIMSKVGTSASQVIPIDKVCTYFGEPNNRSLMRILSIGGSSRSLDFQHFVFVLWNFATIGDNLGMYILIHVIDHNLI